MGAREGVPRDGQRVDITCDLMDEDEAGHMWAFLRDARDQALVQPSIRRVKRELFVEPWT